MDAADDLTRARATPAGGSASGRGLQQAVDPDLSAAVSYSLAQTVEARLRGIRNYTRLIREVQRASSTGDA